MKIPLIALVVPLAIVGGAILFTLPVTRRAREPARRTQCRNNIKQIGLALHNYHHAYGSFPPAYTVDESGNRLHSWRTLLLPFIDQAPLYETIDFSKPWNDPVNMKAFDTPIACYQCPATGISRSDTTYQAIVAPNSCFPLHESRSISGVTDGTSNTIMVVEADPSRALHWMSPMDDGELALLGFDAKTKFPHTLQHVLFADGSVRALSSATTAAQRRAIITADGNDADAIGDLD